MRYQTGHKEATRRQILDRAAARFRRDGIAGVGIKSLMGELGLTHGGFYAHFGSRQDLVARSVAKAIEDTCKTLQAQVAQAAPGEGLAAFVNAYLSSYHRDQIKSGCAGAALACEISRQEEGVRQAFACGTDRIVDLLGEQLPAGGSPEQRRDRAYAVFGALMGTLQLARASIDAAASDRLLSQGRAAALSLARLPWTG